MRRHAVSCRFRTPITVVFATKGSPSFGYVDRFRYLLSRTKPLQIITRPRRTILLRARITIPSPIQEPNMRNITLAIDDKTYHDIRLWCAVRDISVSRVVGTFLADLPRLENVHR